MVAKKGDKYLNKQKQAQILNLGAGLKPKKLEKILAQKVRIEKIVVKDAKLRTFIADDATRGEMVSHVYDVTYGIVNNEKDSLVLLDDSIVRGTTLRDSIVKIVSRLRPKRRRLQLRRTSKLFRTLPHSQHLLWQFMSKEGNISPPKWADRFLRLY